MTTDQYMKDKLSWWEYEHYLQDVDYTIVGSGIVGMSTAIELKTLEPNSKVLVLDQKILPVGASTKNAGFACFGSISEILDDYELYGEATTSNLIQMRWQGLAIMKDRIAVDRMNYKAHPGAEIFKDKDEEEFYISKIPWLNSFVSQIVKTDSCYSFNKGRFGNEIINKLEGSLNPQMMMKELEEIARRLGVLFVTGISVEEIQFEAKVLRTNNGSINFNKLIVCTNGFSKQLLPNINIQPARNQVFITNKISGFHLDKCYHMNKGYVYFRSYEERLLIGGGRDLDKEGETTTTLGTTEMISKYLNDIVRSHILPDQTYEIAHSWSGILGVGDNKMPIVEKIYENVLIAVRMGGMGVAIGSFIGKVAASMVLSIDNSEHRLYVS